MSIRSSLIHVCSGLTAYLRELHATSTPRTEKVLRRRSCPPSACDILTVCTVSLTGAKDFEMGDRFPGRLGSAGATRTDGCVPYARDVRGNELRHHSCAIRLAYQTHSRPYTRMAAFDAHRHRV
ncbi:hypothetical protein OBBRIDRAFT_630706 [Obba rivulosa]|uniref:Uncharacterized protein n=1 Tax=Obba rivulosa TaxID=1052685 RepID=A0A8E2DK21_9APHY|nr:hypothetical protein OBBRIDRAFT_630706 [Obba rivulosa]